MGCASRNLSLFQRPSSSLHPLTLAGGRSLFVGNRGPFSREWHENFRVPVKPRDRGLLFGRKLSLLSPPRLDPALVRSWNDRLVANLVAYSRSKQPQNTSMSVSYRPMSKICWRPIPSCCQIGCRRGKRGEGRANSACGSASPTSEARAVAQLARYVGDLMPYSARARTGARLDPPRVCFLCSLGESGEIGDSECCPSLFLHGQVGDGTRAPHLCLLGPTFLIESTTRQESFRPLSPPSARSKLG